MTILPRSVGAPVPRSPEASAKSPIEVALRDPRAVLLDVRTAFEFDMGHIESSINISHTDIRTRAGELPVAKSTPIIVFCRSGNRSRMASHALVRLGYENVLDGATWQNIQRLVDER